MKARAKLFLLFLPPLLLSGLIISHLAGRAVRATLHAQAAASTRAGVTGTIGSSAAAFASGREQDLLPVLYALQGPANASGVAFAGVSGDVRAHTDVTRKGLDLPGNWKEMLLLPEGGYLAAETRLNVFIPVTEAAGQDPEELALGAARGARLGTLIVTVPLAGVLATEAGISRKISGILVAVYSAILLAAFLITGLALRPVRLLTEGTKRVSRGDYGAVIPVSSRDEFGELARSFNEMSATLSGTIVSKNYLDAIVDNIVDILVVTDPEGGIRRLNKAALAALGKTEDELKDSSVLRLFSAEVPERSGWHDVLRALGEVRDFETVLLTPTAVPVTVSASYISDSGGTRTGIAVIIRDITLRKKYEAELARSNEDLQRFAFVASHDLQEPLRTVSNYIQLLETKYREVLGPEAGRNVDFITGAVKRMRALVKDLLEYSKINAELKLERVDTGQALESVLSMLRESISAAGAKVEAGPLPEISADRCHIERLLLNLISNAVKFRDGRPPEIKVAAKRDAESGWIFSVADNGEGIDPRYASKLFKLFGRLHGAATEGAGIGLASCKRIVDYYGGRIWHESEPGKGSTFFFSIPARPGHGAPAPDAALLS